MDKCFKQIVDKLGYDDVHNLNSVLESLLEAHGQDRLKAEIIKLERAAGMVYLCDKCHTMAPYLQGAFGDGPVGYNDWFCGDCSKGL